jgi:hypothetical protein
VTLITADIARPVIIVVESSHIMSGEDWSMLNVVSNDIADDMAGLLWRF